jgi:hypothetical protein
MNEIVILEGTKIIDEIAIETGLRPVYIYLAAEIRYLNISREEAVQKIWRPLPDYFKEFNSKELDSQKLQKAEKAINRRNQREQETLYNTTGYFQLKGWNSEIFTFLKNPEKQKPNQEPIT